MVEITEEDRTELAKLFFSFGNPNGNWESVADGLGAQSYYRGADRILQSRWFLSKMDQAQDSGIELAEERLSGVLWGNVKTKDES